MGTLKSVLNRVVIISALGYFVDIYDLTLFIVVRRASLLDIGVAEADLLAVGADLLNWQMGGMLLGGLLWGVLGDKRGRLSVLFGSIALYSLANIANAFVPNVETYAALRFIAGIGLAGELGAAITLVTETLPKETRGYGTAIVAGVGIMGAVVGGLVGNAFPWQVAYLVGGGMGIVLLIARIAMVESGMYARAAKATGSRGDLRLLFGSWTRSAKYLRSVLIGLPIWCIIGILIAFSPEIGRDLGIRGPVNAGYAILWTYAGAAMGDFTSGALSQYFRSRRNVVIGFIGMAALCIFIYYFARGIPVEGFYAICTLLGFFAGYWAVFVTMAAEQFGTNLRSTVAATVPNMIRGSVVPLTLLFRWLIPYLGTARSAMVLGAFCVLVALWAVRRLDETIDKDLDYLEEAPSPRPDRVRAVLRTPRPVPQEG